MKIAVAGAAGRMGQMLVREIARTEGCTLAGALEGAGSTMLGREAGEVAGVGSSHRSLKGVKIVADANAALAHADAVFDFTVPAATFEHAKAAGEKGVAMVIGTTGLDRHQRPFGADREYRLDARSRLRHRGAGDAPSSQDRRALGHCAGARPRRG